MEAPIDREHVYGTINCNGVNAKGEICGVTTTSGLAWTIPGRVGDSPILGAGLYVDLCSFLIVEEIRRGAHPKDAGLTALKRVAKATVEKRLLNARNAPNFGLNFYILNAAFHFRLSTFGLSPGLPTPPGRRRRCSARTSTSGRRDRGRYSVGRRTACPPAG